jgi:hypothetical protein
MNTPLLLFFCALSFAIGGMAYMTLATSHVTNDSKEVKLWRNSKICFAIAATFAVACFVLIFKNQI